MSAVVALAVRRGDAPHRVRRSSRSARCCWRCNARRLRRLRASAARQRPHAARAVARLSADQGAARAGARVRRQGTRRRGARDRHHVAAADAGAVRRCVGVGGLRRQARAHRGGAAGIVVEALLASVALRAVAAARAGAGAKDIAFAVALHRRRLDAGSSTAIRCCASTATTCCAMRSSCRTWRRAARATGSTCSSAGCCGSAQLRFPAPGARRAAVAARVRAAGVGCTAPCCWCCWRVAAGQVERAVRARGGRARAVDAGHQPGARARCAGSPRRPSCTASARGPRRWRLLARRASPARSLFALPLPRSHARAGRRLAARRRASCGSASTGSSRSCWCATATRVESGTPIARLSNERAARSSWRRSRRCSQQQHVERGARFDHDALRTAAGRGRDGAPRRRARPAAASASTSWWCAPASPAGSSIDHAAQPRRPATWSRAMCSRTCCRPARRWCARWCATKTSRWCASVRARSASRSRMPAARRLPRHARRRRAAGDRRRLPSAALGEAGGGSIAIDAADRERPHRARAALSARPAPRRRHRRARSARARWSRSATAMPAPPSCWAAGCGSRSCAISSDERPPFCRRAASRSTLSAARRHGRLQMRCATRCARCARASPPATRRRAAARHARTALAAAHAAPRTTRRWQHSTRDCRC